MNQRRQRTSIKIRPTLQFSAGQRILRQRQTSLILRRKVTMRTAPSGAETGAGSRAPVIRLSTNAAPSPSRAAGATTAGAALQPKCSTQVPSTSGPANWPRLLACLYQADGRRHRLRCGRRLRGRRRRWRLVRARRPRARVPQRARRSAAAVCRHRWRSSTRRRKQTPAATLAQIGTPARSENPEAT